MWAPAVMQSAEELDKQRLEAQQKRDAQMKQERADRAKKNAEVLAQQKVRAGRVQPPSPPPPPPHTTPSSGSFAHSRSP